MTNKTLSSHKYYLALAHFIIACEAQAEVRRHEKILEKILQNDMVGDSLYDPSIAATKENFDDVLRKYDIQVDWLLDDKKKTKKEGKETQ